MRVTHVISLSASPTTAVAQSMKHWPNLRNSTVCSRSGKRVSHEKEVRMLDYFGPDSQGVDILTKWSLNKNWLHTCFGRDHVPNAKVLLSKLEGGWFYLQCFSVPAWPRLSKLICHPLKVCVLCKTELFLVFLTLPTLFFGYCYTFVKYFSKSSSTIESSIPHRPPVSD